MKKIIFSVSVFVLGGLLYTFSNAIGQGNFESDILNLLQEIRQQLQELRQTQDDVGRDALETIEEGRQIFRFDTFGGESFWGETLRLHEAVAGEEQGGVGPGLDPTTALELGLKVDAQALSPEVLDDLQADEIDLDDPAVTLDLLRANAVVGLTGFFDQGGSITSIGIHCALCHATVDDSIAPGIGRRLDGWANRDLNVGAVIALAPNLQPFVDLLAIVTPGITDEDVRTVLNSWGPGKFDAELILDGKAVNPETGESGATLIPPAFGLAGVNLHTWTGWGSVPHWNAFVANLEMHGQGTFFDPRLDDPEKFPIAAAMGFDNVRNDPDLITAKLPALHFYQLSLQAPPAPEEGFDAEGAARGQEVFQEAGCAGCHVPPLFTEPGWNLHTPEEVGVDDFQARRSPDERYRTSPLKGLWTHTQGGFYHDGRFATLDEVIDHYDQLFDLDLIDDEKDDLREYLLSL